MWEIVKILLIVFVIYAIACTIVMMKMGGVW